VAKVLVHRKGRTKTQLAPLGGTWQPAWSRFLFFTIFLFFGKNPTKTRWWFAHLLEKLSVTLVSKRGCHLCERVTKTLDLIKEKRTFDFTILYVEDDPALFDQYWIRVPVVRLNGVDKLEARDLALNYEPQLERIISSQIVAPDH
jgi:glutaredoxin